MDMLLAVRESDTLVVSFHGAIDRRKYTLPRFERYRSLNRLLVSALYIGDPALWVSEDLELAWHTGWDGNDLFPIHAEMIASVSAQIGAKHVVLNGGSGGGFAALQASALLPESTAVAYNPQTSIYAYLHPRWPRMPQGRYLRHVWPDLLGVDVSTFDYSYDWTEPLGDRLSAVRRYQVPRRNKVVFMINSQDEHHVEDHFVPFYQALTQASNQMRVIRYDGGEGHNPTTFAQFKQGLDAAAEWGGFSIDED